MSIRRSVGRRSRSRNRHTSRMRISASDRDSKQLVNEIKKFSQRNDFSSIEIVVLHDSQAEWEQLEQMDKKLNEFLRDNGGTGTNFEENSEIDFNKQEVQTFDFMKLINYIRANSEGASIYGYIDDSSKGVSGRFDIAQMNKHMVQFEWDDKITS